MLMFRINNPVSDAIFGSKPVYQFARKLNLEANNQP